MYLVIAVFIISAFVAGYDIGKYREVTREFRSSSP